MNVALCYFSYLIISIGITVWVARTLHKNGRVFLVDAFHGNTELADSVNHLLVVGFYLINVGYIALALKTTDPLATVRQAIELESVKIGVVLLILGAMHFFNIFVFARMRRRATAMQPTASLAFSVCCSGGAMTAASTEVRKKSDETRMRILEAALAVFRERGFERATMREIAAAAGVAVGAAYYYFDSKDAIVMAFYVRSHGEMRRETNFRLDESKTLEDRLRAIIGEKFKYFAPDRRLLGALSAHADPEHPLSPFSQATAVIREEDVALFERAAKDSKVKLPASVAPYLARLLWMYQMGLILFWVYDRSEGQERTALLYEKTLKMLLVTLKIAGFPLLRPLHRLAGELLRVIYGGSEAHPEQI